MQTKGRAVSQQAIVAPLQSKQNPQEEHHGHQLLTILEKDVNVKDLYAIEHWGAHEDNIADNADKKLKLKLTIYMTVRKMNRR